jgi:uncharacterized membrane protein YccC
VRGGHVPTRRFTRCSSSDRFSEVNATDGARFEYDYSTKRMTMPGEATRDAERAVQRPGFPRLPPYFINGITVAIGIGLAQVAVLAIGPVGSARVASTGAMYASLPHLVDRAGRSTRRALAGGVIGSTTAALMAAVTPHALLLHVTLAVLVFAAAMMMAWGQRAGPVSFTVILAIVFSLATPQHLPLFEQFAWTLGGATLYSAWAYGSTRLLEPRYRTLTLARALETSARVLVSRADVLETRAPLEVDAKNRWLQIDEETNLAATLQSARDVVLTGNARSGRINHLEVLVRATELRDLLLTSRLDLDLLGEDGLAYEIRARLAAALRSNASALTTLASSLATESATVFDRTHAQRVIARILDERGLPRDDPRLRLLAPIASRQQQLLELIVAIHALVRGVPREQPAGILDFGLHAGDENWPLSELTRQLSLKSPICRHALRSAVAIATAHAVSTVLPWTTHPHWIVLSVAVVLRGTFAQTVSRRNDRVIGTAAGCLLALGLATVVPKVALAPIIWLATGTAHAFVNVRYKLTAVAATVMALLQTLSADSITTVVALERLADTVIGAGFAWAFSYVLPSWSRRTLPGLLETTLGALRTYAETAPSLAANAPVRQRLARERAYGSLDAFVSGVRLSRVEPADVRPPLPLLLSFIDHAQSLMAHLSSLRLLLIRRAAQLRGPDTDRALDRGRGRLVKRLELDAEPYSASPRVQPLHLELPVVPIEQAAFPWLVRRLNVAIYEADRTGQSARAALAVLRERASLRPPPPRKP